MPELIPPSAARYGAWQTSRAEWGPGAHEDGFGLSASDDVDSAVGFAAWVARLREQGAQAEEASQAAQAEQAEQAERREQGGSRTCYRWIAEGDQVLGAIALREGPADYVSWAGHIGYGIRPSARGRGLAAWALEQMLVEARGWGMELVLVVCAVDNTASSRTIEKCRGVLEGIGATAFGPVLRYWIAITDDGRAIAAPDGGREVADPGGGRAR